MRWALEKIQSIAIVGAGTMGTGIAQVCALAGYPVTLHDISEEVLEKAKRTIEKNLSQSVEKKKLTEEEKKACLQRITFTQAFENLVAEVIVEAIIEQLSAKQELFIRLAQQNKTDSIFATNTSSIPITRIAHPIPHPKRVVGMHFFNPAHIMKLVEIISGAATDPQVVQVIYDLAKKIGKEPIIAKDTPGFIVNRVGRHYYTEALKILEENVADISTIDAVMENTGFKMGPFRLMDLIGVDTNFFVTTSLFESFHYDPKFRPSRIQQQKVDAGYHGRKAGKGFYEYE